MEFDITEYNAQASSFLPFFFNKKTLKIATMQKLNELKHLAEEVPYKWCLDNVRAEFRRRDI